MIGKKPPKEIVVDISENGEIEIQGQNFKGIACQKATAFLEKALGLIKSCVLKKERWQRDEQNIQLH